MSDSKASKDSEENKTVKQKILKVTKDTLEGSSIHAIPNIVRTESILLRVIWGVFFLGSIGVCGWYLSQAISSYLDYEIVTTFQVNNVNQLPFPVVSICDLKSFYDKQAYNNGIGLTSINRALFLEKDLDLEKDFEAYNDPSYGNCIRFNSRKIKFRF